MFYINDTSAYNFPVILFLINKIISRRKNSKMMYFLVSFFCNIFDIDIFVILFRNKKLTF